MISLTRISSFKFRIYFDVGGDDGLLVVGGGSELLTLDGGVIKTMEKFHETLRVDLDCRESYAGELFDNVVALGLEVGLGFENEVFGDLNFTRERD